MGIIFRIVNVIGENVCMAMQKFVKIYLNFYDSLCL